MPNNNVTATLVAEITTAFQPLRTLFALLRAGKYSNYKEAYLVNRAATPITYSVVEAGFPASTGNSCTLQSGEQVRFGELNTSDVYILGVGSSGDNLEFKAEIA